MSTEALSGTLMLVSTNADLAGAPIHVRHLVNELREIAPQLRIIAVFGEHGPIEERIRAAGVKTYVVPQIRSSISPFKDLVAIYRLVRIAHEEGVDLIHAHSTKAGFVARCAAFLLRKPSIFTVHGWGFGPGRGRMQSIVVKLMERIVRPSTSTYLAVSECDATVAREELGIDQDKINIVENGVPDRIGRSNPASSNSMVMVARVTYAKDHETVLRAYRGVKRCDATLSLTGAQTDESEFAKSVDEWAGEATDTVRLLGVREDITELLNDAGTFVLASRFEGMPLSIIEAMRAGLPVIATQVGGVPEVVEHGVTGLLVPVGDVQRLRDAMQLLATNPQMRASMGQAGRNRYEQRFSARVMAFKVIAQYARLMESQREPQIRKPVSPSVDAG